MPQVLTVNRNRPGNSLASWIRTALLLLGGFVLTLAGLPLIGLSILSLCDNGPIPREKCWEALPMLAFLGMACSAIGIFALVQIVSRWRQRHIENVLRALHPGEPWLWRREWNTGEIRRASKSELISKITFAIYCNGFFFAWLIMGLGQHFAKRVSPAFIVVPVLFLSVMGIFFSAVRDWRDWYVWGDAIFRIERGPGVIGGVLGGTVCSKCIQRPTARVRLTLSCRRYKHQYDRSGKILWKDSLVIPPEVVRVGFDGLEIPVLFHIPYGCAPETSCEMDSAGTRICWRLELKGGGFGRRAAVYARFEAPVFTTASSDPNYQPLPYLAAFKFRRTARPKSSSVSPGAKVHSPPA